MSSNADKIVRPLGLWSSPFTPKMLASQIRLSDVLWDSDGETLVWREQRSAQGVLVCLPAGEVAPRDLTSTLNVRAQVGYGGGDFTVAHGHAYFVEQSGRIYRQSLESGEPVPLTPEFGHAASPVVSPDGRWLLYVYTYEHKDGLALADAAGAQWPQQIAQGADFYMQPCWHPDGDRSAWVQWNHPQMPWDGTELHLGVLDMDGASSRITHDQVLAGSSDVSISQPAFSPDGRYLAYISDAIGWGNLYIYELASGEHRPLTQDEIESGAPAWIQGLRTYGWSADGQCIYVVRSHAGFHRLWQVEVASGKAQQLEGEWSEYTHLGQPSVAPRADAWVCLASASTIPPRVVRAELTGARSVQVLRRSAPETIPADHHSPAEAISWINDASAVIHGLYHPPHNPRYTGSGAPPAIILIHGGPTSQTMAAYQPQAQFFTSRGYAVLHVNYRGSTGYGRTYMEALRGNWGVHDVDDAVNGARHLADTGRADRERLVIMGGSAGGYTVLLALVQHPGFFRAGICLYGVSNLFTLAADTHKFEERYLDSLVGPLPEASPVYRERSAIFAADRIQDPLAMFQGEEDRVVPRDQADAVVESLRRRGVPHEYHLYPGEGHGWRQTETIEKFYTAVERFLRQYVIWVYSK